MSKRSSRLFLLSAIVNIMIAGSLRAQVLQPLLDVAPIDREADLRLHPREIANGVERGKLVTERARPEYDPVGTRIGPIEVFPALGLSESLDSNIYRSANRIDGDLITSVTPNVAAHGLEMPLAWSLSAEGDIARHVSHPREDWDDWTTAAAVRIEAPASVFLTLDGKVRNLHEDRSSPESTNGYQPDRYRQRSAEFGAGWQPSAIDIRFDALVRSYDYANNFGSTGTIDNSDLNRVETDFRLRAGYEFAPSSEIFFRVGYDDRRYRTARDRYGYRRGGDGQSVSLGTAIDLGGLVIGELAAGYLSQSFRDSRFTSVGTPVFEGRLFWEVTPLVTASLSGSRSIGEVVLPSAASFVATQADLSIEYELLRSTVIVLRPVYETVNFTDSVRTDVLWYEQAELRYSLTQGMQIRISEVHTNRESNQSDANYHGDLASLSVVLAY